MEKDLQKLQQESTNNENSLSSVSPTNTIASHERRLVDLEEEIRTLNGRIDEVFFELKNISEPGLSNHEITKNLITNLKDIKKGDMVIVSDSSPFRLLSFKREDLNLLEIYALDQNWIGLIILILVGTIDIQISKLL